MSIQDTILQKIKKNKVKPKSRLYFAAINIGWWILFALLFLFGSISFSVSLYMIKGSNWAITNMVADSFGERLLLVLPRFWILFIIIAIVLAVWEFSKTKKGYRYNLIIVLVSVILGSTLLGFLVYASGFSEKLDTLFTDNIPIYRGRMHQQMELWNREDKGLFTGHIIGFENDELRIMRPPHTEWIVDAKNISNEVLLDLEEDQIIRIVGEIVDDNVIEASEIKPLRMRHFGDIDKNMDTHGMYFERNY